MSIEFNPDSGHLRLDRDSFARLTEWFREGRPGAVPPELSAAGALDDQGDLHPVPLACLATVAAPLCRIAVRMTDPAGRLEQGDLWLGPEVAGMLLELPDGRAELGLLHPIFVPVMLWRVLALGPRLRLSADAVAVDPGTLDQLTDPRPERRADAVRVLAQHGVTGAEELRCDARVQASWVAPGGAPGIRVVRVLDTPAGLWHVTREGDLALLTPTTASAVWRELVSVLPNDQELPASE
ncbi:hypothetical protein JQS43_05100 [Natronosporangium hydrolyticum]|uniref:Uncharacterized protein n=1 Tax=Natronosporangium hydrolyticum TaxID=2811111 RepID=A0A895YP39_9ACTN|nr:hypothetical protein [Natronosporangium hydrolyticum]QSB15718.1 hypothetical protein JQS43_05100 [Natronosporangium hydrolyticum]